MPLRLDLVTPVIDDRPVFVTGNFSHWHPAVDRLQLQPVAPGRYTLEFPAELSLPDVVEYKYTRGGWDHVELNGAGEGVPNRVLLTGTGQQADYVPHWRWFGQAFNPAFRPVEQLLSDAFDSPELGTSRRVTALLPYDYHKDPTRRYPVLYLNDGQNLVGDGAGYGSWAIEQKLAILASRQQHQVIVVTVDHGQQERINEFTIDKSRMGKGRGRQYLRFLTRTLKPVIDAQLRTLPDSEHTGLGGSSLGGLISIYGGLFHPDVFGRLLVFSPSLWISPKIYFDAIQFRAPAPMRIYVYGGEAESQYMVPNLQRFKDSLLKQCYNGQPIDIHLSVDPAGIHQETHWGREFPAALEWLFFN